MAERKIPLTGIDTLAFLGYNDANLQIIEDHFDATIAVRGDQVLIKGSDNEINRIERVLNELIFILNKNGNLTPNDVETVIDLTSVNGQSFAEPQPTIIEESAEPFILYTKSGVIKCRSQGQKNLVLAAKRNDIVFTIGPAGTGKTYLAVALAVAALRNRDVTRIVLTRPAVEAGENLGFLPGDFREKIDPYLRPLYDALGDMITTDKLASYIEKRIIEIAPLAYMRGRTLHNSFMILDEAQNASAMQMKMFLTRMGINSKGIITGDITQVDLPSKTTSGLIQIQGVLKGIPGISFVYLDRNDVVRHRLVRDIIDAYEKFNTKLNGQEGNNKETQSNS